MSDLLLGMTYSGSVYITWELGACALHFDTEQKHAKRYVVWNILLWD